MTRQNFSLNVRQQRLGACVYVCRNEGRKTDRSSVTLALFVDIAFLDAHLKDSIATKTQLKFIFFKG